VTDEIVDFMTKLISISQAAAVLCFFIAVPAGAQDSNGGGPASLGRFSASVFGAPAQDPIVGGAVGVAPTGEVTIASAQDPVAEEAAAAYAPFSADALDQLLRPIALYPDPLLAEVLAAASVPAQIVLADRHVNSGGDLSEIEEQPWDPSVQALAHYPTVLKWLDDNLPWTTQVGEAFLNQQQDVMASIQRLRLMAQSAGNLPSTPQENVVTDNGTVEIEPANPEVIFVPIYPWNNIFYDSGFYCTFGVGFPIGIWLRHDWDWHHHHLIEWGPGHPRPTHWWTGPARNRVAPPNATYWRGPARGSGVSAGRADRGFATGTVHNTQRLAAPSSPAPSSGAPREIRGGTVAVVPGGHVETTPRISTEIGRVATPSAGVRPGVEAHSLPSVTRMAPVERAPSAGGSSGGGAFGGAESSFEARQSSVRGVESRSTISAPSSHYEAPSAPASHYEAPASPPSHSSQPPASSGSSHGR